MAHSFKVYPTYRFTKQDPIVKEVLAVAEEDPDLSMSKAAKKAGLGNSTPVNWKTKKTMRPQHATMAAYLGVYGKRFYIGDK